LPLGFIPLAVAISLFFGVKHILFKARDKINANQLYEAKLAEMQRQELQVAQASAGEG
jgi:hypothetical protein